jgi:hypothetical protein
MNLRLVKSRRIISLFVLEKSEGGQPMIIPNNASFVSSVGMQSLAVLNPLLALLQARTITFIPKGVYLVASNHTEVRAKAIGKFLTAK